jgi:hypothetical protein
VSDTGREFYASDGLDANECVVGQSAIMRFEALSVFFRYQGEQISARIATRLRSNAKCQIPTLGRITEFLGYLHREGHLLLRLPVSVYRRITSVVGASGSHELRTIDGYKVVGDLGVVWNHKRNFQHVIISGLGFLRYSTPWVQRDSKPLPAGNSKGIAISTADGNLRWSLIRRQWLA